jgi:hypothetical protein
MARHLARHFVQRFPLTLAALWLVLTVGFIMIFVRMS